MGIYDVMKNEVLIPEQRDRSGTMEKKMRMLLLFLVIAMLLLSACSPKEKAEDPTPEPDEEVEGTVDENRMKRNLLVNICSPFTGIQIGRGKHATSCTCDD